MIQYGLFEVLRDVDFHIGFNEASRRLYEDALLSDDAVGWVLWPPNLISYRFSSLQDKPAIFVMEAVAGKEESYAIVGCKIYQVGFAAVMLKFRQDFKLIAFLSVLFSLVQNLLLDNLYIEVLYVNITILAVQA